MKNSIINSKNVVQLLREYNQNPDNKRLIAHYDSRTIFDIIGKGRNETAHSAFLEWLFSGRDISGTSNENTIIGLLDAVTRRIDEQSEELRSDKSIIAISNALLSRTLQITDIRSRTELPVIKVAAPERRGAVSASLKKHNKKKAGKTDSIDIYIACDIKGVEDIEHLEIFIENKIGSKEGGAKDSKSDNEYDRLTQTQRYYWACKKEGNNDKVYQLFVYLSATDYDALYDENNRAKSDKFVCINYQDIYDDVLSPLLESEKLADREEYIIKEYVKVLSIPMVYKSDDNADGTSKTDNINKSIILATSKQERELLRTYWRSNQLLIIHALKAYEDDDSEGKQHDWSRYIDINGNIYTKVEYIQAVYNLYKNKWEKNEVFRKRELAEIFLPCFNEQFTRGKKVGKFLRLRDNLSIEFLTEDGDELDRALEILRVDNNGMSDHDKNTAIIEAYKEWCTQYSAENAFNSKIKTGIAHCQNIIEDDLVKCNTSKLLDDILKKCQALEDPRLVVELITYPDEYRQVLADFWKVNKPIIMASARILSDSNELTYETRKGIKEAYENISKSNTNRFKVSLNNDRLQLSGLEYLNNGRLQPADEDLDNLSKLGVVKWFIQTLIWDGTRGARSLKGVNDELEKLTGQELISNIEKKPYTYPISKPSWVNGEPNTYYFNKNQYIDIFDKIIFPYLKNNEAGYTIEQIK